MGVKFMILGFSSVQSEERDAKRRDVEATWLMMDMEVSRPARATSASASAARRAPADDRRCDFSLAKVALPGRVDARVAATREDRGFRSVSSDDTDGDDATSDKEVAWRRQLELHVVDMIRQVRLEPATLRKLLQVVGALMLRRQAEREQQLGGANFKALGRQHVEAEVGMKAATGVGLNGPMARRILQEFHQVACGMGEDVYKRVRGLVMRSVARGALSLDANTVRLESVFRLELRRQVTVDGVLERMVSVDADRSGRDRSSSIFRVVGDESTHCNKSVETNSPDRVQVDALTTAPLSPESTRVRARSAPPTTAMKRERVASAHAFKMRSLERLLDIECERKGSAKGSGSEQAFSFYPSTAPALEVTEAEYVNDKITAFLYHRSRENFPFWREPPENGLSREDTAKILRVAITALLGSAMFGFGLSIEQLLEILRSMKWRYLHEGQTTCILGNEIQEVIVLIEGEVIVGKQSNEERALDTFTIVDETTDTGLVGSRSNNSDNDSEVQREPETKSTKLFTLSAPACVGELGMVRAGERWLHTLTSASAATVKLLTISKAAFDLMLLRLFAGGKSSAQPASQQPQPPPDRPVSSPGVVATGRRRTQMMTTLASSKNVLAIERQLAKSHSRRQEALQLGLSSSNPNKSDTTKNDQEKYRQPSPRDFQQVKSHVQPPSSDRTTNEPTQNNLNGAPKAKRSSPFQYYPTFNLRADGPSGSDDITSQFRIKWAQPIAFEMQSSHDDVREEWAPPFPDTRAYVDFLSPSSLDAVSMLFDKPNFLSIAVLRTICHRHPFLDGAYGRGRPRANAITPPASPTKHGGGEIDTVTFVVEANTLLSSRPPVDQRRIEEISLTQFTDARKKMRSNSVSLRAMPSARSLISSPLSPMISGKKASLEPYVGSAFVPESSFRTGASPRHGESSGILEEVNSVAEGENDNGPDQGPELRSSDSPIRQESISIANAGDAETEATLARKRALESLTLSGEQTKRNSKIINDATAKQVIIQRHLETISPSSPQTPSHDIASTRAEPENPEQPPPNSHAPLPLRVDLQKRMDSVLSSLQMRARAKLALVLKYTHVDNYDRFPIAVVLWEQASKFVQRREDVLAELRAFELVASDPRRHFRSLSTHRLQEQKQRDALFGRLNTATGVCIEALNELRARCGDDLYLDDRLYRDKMTKDYTELLFEVEQERLDAIYRGVKPGFYLSSGHGDSADRCEDDDTIREEGSKSITKRRASLQIRIPTVNRELPTFTKSPVKAETPWTRNNNNNDEEADSFSLQADDGVSTGKFALGGVDAVAPRTRFALRTPSESIYLPFQTQLNAENTPAKDQTSSPEENESASMAPSKPVGPRGGMNHRMAAQVQAQRQAELAALTGRINSTQRPDLRRPQAPTLQAKADDDLRGGENLISKESETSSLRHLLRAFVNTQRDK